MKRILSFLFALLLLSALVPVSAEEEKSQDIVILSTNDVHGYIDGPLSYDTVAAVKKELLKSYEHVFLVDAGDHVQGTAYGSMDQGRSIVKLMNAAGYDAATLGNHEFDYGMDTLKSILEWADYPYLSSNFYYGEDPVTEPYLLFPCGEETLGIVGVTTPTTLNSTSPLTFQNEKGEFVYSFRPIDYPKILSRRVSAARSAGATKVVVLGHLGLDSSDGAHTSANVTALTKGYDALIDGHSHSTVERMTVKNTEGKDVVITQTGEYFQRIGMMVISAVTGEIATDFIETEPILAEDGKTVTGYRLSSELYPATEIPSDPEVRALKEAWINEVDGKLDQKIGTTPLRFDNYDAAGKRLVRQQETNSGDFAADALYYLFDSMGMDVDLAVMNGGGVRNTALTGEISYKTCKEIHTFGNVACLQTMTGQQILDMLEWGARAVGEADEGGFLQVSGLKYRINTALASTVKEDENGAWSGPPESYRVSRVEIFDKETLSYRPLELDALYNVAGYNFTLRDQGDGFTMLKDAKNVLDYVMEDYMVLANYVSAFDGGTVKADNSPLLKKYPSLLLDYSSVNGCGRIAVTNEVPSAPVTADGGSLLLLPLLLSLALTLPLIKRKG